MLWVGQAYYLEKLYEEKKGIWWVSTIPSVRHVSEEGIMDIPGLADTMLKRTKEYGQ